MAAGEGQEGCLKGDEGEVISEFPRDLIPDHTSSNAGELAAFCRARLAEDSEANSNPRAFLGANSFAAATPPVGRPPDRS